MRFGIMTLQLQSLIPSGVSAEQAISHLGNLDYATLIRSLVEAGFKNIEIGGDMALFFPHTLQPPSIEALLALKSELDISYSVHLPLWSLEPSTPYEPVRSASVRVMADTIRATLPLEPEVYVMHATGALAAEFYRMALPDLAKAMVIRQFQSYAEQSLTSLLKETGLHPRRIAIETIEFPFDLTLEIAEALDLSICLDTGHVLVGFSGPVTIDQVLDQSGSRIAEIHLHDGPWQGPDRKIGYGLDHKPLGTGDLDVGSLLDRLQAMSFDGPIIFELQLHEALQSLEVVRNLRPDYLL